MFHAFLKDRADHFKVLFHPAQQLHPGDVVINGIGEVAAFLQVEPHLPDRVVHGPFGFQVKIPVEPITGNPVAAGRADLLDVQIHVMALELMHRALDHTGDMHNRIVAGKDVIDLARHLLRGRIKEEMSGILREGADVRIDYIEIVDSSSMEPLDKVRENTLIAVAAFVGGTRLIDNVIINDSGKGLKEG